MRKRGNNRLDMLADVLVVGGGAAGIGAALAAAQRGSRTIMIEAGAFPGGAAGRGLIDSICGLPSPGEGEAGDLPSSKFVRGFLAALAEISGQPLKRIETEEKQSLVIMPYRPWDLIRLADRLLSRQKGLDVVYHCNLTDVETRLDRPHRAAALAWNRRIDIGFQTLVDCSGEATAIDMAGGETLMPQKNQGSGIIFALENLDSDLHERNAALRMRYEIVRSVEQGRLPEECATISMTHGSLDSAAARFKLCLPPLAVGCEHIDSSNQQTSGREAVFALLEFLRENVDGFRDARLTGISSTPGVRVGRRAKGVYRLCAEDLHSRRVFPDTVALGTWPIEVWDRGAQPRLDSLNAEGNYEIPLRCLKSDGIEYAWMGGRCISADDEVLASARVSGTALATGWAAGAAASNRAQEIPARTNTGRE